MRRIIVVTVTLLLSATLLYASVAMAAKPANVIPKSNGFPSGMHFNLNLHGRDPANWAGEPSPGGNSVFISISGNSTVQYVSNKRNLSNTQLVVLDPLSEGFDGDAAQVYLPYNIVDEADNVTKPAGGYYVYGRILAKPDNGTGGTPSSILVYPNFIVAAANATDENPNSWPFDPDTDLFTLGLITTQGNLYRATPEGFVRFDPSAEGGKGKSTAVEITDLFKWSGYVTDNTSLDVNGNGYLDEGDVPAEYDANGNGVIEQTELIAWLEYLVSIGEAVKYEATWIFDIADMVMSGQTFVNDGTKLFQIRFYPVATTTIK